MKFYDTIQQVSLDNDTVNKAMKFAEEVIATINYSDSNQSDKKKITNDHFISKLGEEAVKIVFEPFAKVVGPDYMIYDAKQKKTGQMICVSMKLEWL